MMRKNWIAALRATRLACLTSLIAGGSAFAGGSGGNPCLPHHAVEDEVILELEDYGSIDAIMAAVTPNFPGVEVMLAFPSSHLYLLNAPDPICEKQLVNALNALPGVSEAELSEQGESVEGQTQSFFFASSQGAFDAQYAWPTIRMIDAQSEALGDGVIVAVIDSGLSVDHPIFAKTNILEGVDYVNDGQGLSDIGNGLDDDGDGAIDELSGHGTFVSGIITTIAPNAAILPLRAIDTDGHGTAFAVAQALVEARDRGAGIINLSFTTPQGVEALKPLLQSLIQQGILIVVSAGNGGTVGLGPFPASLPGACAVAATDQNDVKAAFSNAGTFVSLCAPGIGIVSSFPGGGYVVADGTSASAAIISGTAALVMSKNICSGAEAKAIIKASAASIELENPKNNGTLGAGRVQAGDAVNAIPVPGDYDHDRKIDGDDLGFLIGAWGTPQGDINGDGTTDSIDLGILIGGWTG